MGAVGREALCCEQWLAKGEGRCEGGGDSTEGRKEVEASPPETAVGFQRIVVSSKEGWIPRINQPISCRESNTRGPPVARGPTFIEVFLENQRSTLTWFQPSG